LPAAAVVTSSNSDLPPLEGRYVQSSDTPEIAFTVGFSLISLKDFSWSNFADMVRAPQLGFPGNQTQDYNAIFGGTLVSGVATNFSTTAPIQTLAKGILPSPPLATPIDTEILSLTLSGVGMPTGVQLRINPNVPSTGTTTITQNGALFDFTSHFFLNLQLSIDGGFSFVPANEQMKVELVSNAVPEPSGLSLTGFILASMMILRLRPSPERVNQSGPGGGSSPMRI
jgi:hypothetical protein